MADFGKERGVGSTRTVPPAIVAVGVNNTVTQYQNGVLIQLDYFSETITAVTLDGVACTITGQVVGQSVTVNLPGSVATGTKTVLVSGASESDSYPVTYTNTHPITCPVNGTTIPGASAADPGRSLIYGVALDLAPYVVAGALPSTLQFKSPHVAWTAGNINLPLNEVVEPSVTAVDGDIAAVTLGVLKSDGSSASTTVNITIYLDVTHILRLSNANGTALMPINYLFPTGWIISNDLALPLQDITLVTGETTITQSNIVTGQIGDLTVGELVTVMLTDVTNNLGAICPGIEVEAA